CPRCWPGGAAFASSSVSRRWPCTRRRGRRRRRPRTPPAPGAACRRACWWPAGRSGTVRTGPSGRIRPRCEFRGRLGVGSRTLNRMLAETQIANLLYRYAECIDAGDLPGAAALFEHARIRIGGEDTVDAARLLSIWKSLIVLHPDGTP